MKGQQVRDLRPSGFGKSVFHQLCLARKSLIVQGNVSPVSRRDSSHFHQRCNLLSVNVHRICRVKSRSHESDDIPWLQVSDIDLVAAVCVEQTDIAWLLAPTAFLKEVDLDPRGAGESPLLSESL